MSDKGAISKGLIKHWFLFPEVKQNWLGYSKVGNGGSGLGTKFAAALNENLSSIFNNFGNEQITKSSHLEKLIHTHVILFKMDDHFIKLLLKLLKIALSPITLFE